MIDGTDAQKQCYLPGLASGEIIGSFCLTEPDVGSDAALLETQATRDGHAYVLNGTKRYITNAPRAHVFTVMARTDPAEPGARGVSAFLVDVHGRQSAIVIPETIDAIRALTGSAWGVRWRPIPEPA